MKEIGSILKMETQIEEIVQYYLPIGKSKVFLNNLIGKKLILKFDGQINCINCNKEIPKTYAQGFCYSCFIDIPQTEDCVLRPELCRAHEGIARDMEWAKENCLNDHFVYLAITSGLKVGVTRKSQVPTRWIDQGAVKAIKLAKTPNRYYAGLVEVELKQHMADKTNWRRMLTNIIDKDIDLIAEKQEKGNLLSSELQQYLSEDDKIYLIDYPVIEYPQKVKSIGFDKIKEYQDLLIGIKGQYLIFRGGEVLNIRKHTGYNIQIETVAT